MNERKTSSMLQRVPVILAVTAASYGLQLPVQIGRIGHAEAGVTTASTDTGAPSHAAADAGAKQRAA
jgi:hypothetical protein